MNRFYLSRCLNDNIDLPDILGSLVSGTTTSQVAKHGTKKLFKLHNFKLKFCAI